MSLPPKEPTVRTMRQWTPQAKMELVSFLQPFFRDRKGGGAAAAGGGGGGGGSEFGPRHYFEPIAPATHPPDYIAADPLAGTFDGLWGNLAGALPMFWRTAPGGIEVGMGGVTGDEATPGRRSGICLRRRRRRTTTPRSSRRSLGRRSLRHS